jgi:hypothetical protein
VFLRGAGPQLDDLTDKLVSGCDGRLHVRLAVLVAPEHGGAMVALGVPGADAAPRDAHEQLALSQAGTGDSGHVFDPVVADAVAPNGAHGCGYSRVDNCHHDVIRVSLVFLGAAAGGKLSTETRGKDTA